MFANVFLKTLRDLRWSILGWGVGLGIIVAIEIFEYQQFMGDIRQQAEFAKAYQAFGFLIGEYVPIETLGGFLTLELAVYGAAIVGLWAAVSAVAATRGEEEPGTLEMLVSSPKSRLSVFLQKMAAIGVGLFIIPLLIAFFFFAAVFGSGQTLPPGAITAELFNIALAGGTWGAAGALVAQFFARRRTASVLTGTVIFATYLLNSTMESIPSLRDWTWLLPFHYYSISKPLVPGRSLDPVGILVMAAAVIVMLALAAWLFVRRDIGATTSIPLTRERTETSRRRGSLALLGSTFGKDLRDLALPALLWGVGLAAYCVLIVYTITEALAPMYQAMNAQPWFTKLFGAMATNEAYLSVSLLTYLPLVMVVFALTQVAGWASDEEEGRTGFVVSEPVPRWQMLLSRFTAAAIGLAVILALITGSLLLGAETAGVKLDAGRVTGAVLSTAPLVLVVLAAGLALAAWLPRPAAATTIVGVAVVVMFFIETLAPFFEWPEFVRNLSIFHLYGKPATEGLVWGNIGLLSAVTLLLGAFGLAGFQRRDLVA